MPTPSETIARLWHEGRGIEYEGVNLGECMEYDVLQIINRILIQEEKHEPTLGTVESGAGETTDVHQPDDPVGQ